MLICCIYATAVETLTPASQDVLLCFSCLQSLSFLVALFLTFHPHFFVLHYYCYFCLTNSHIFDPHFFFTTGWVYDKCSRVPRKAWAKERGREKGQYCSYTYRTNFYLHAHNATLGSAVTYSLIIPGCLLHIMQIGRACIELRMSGKLKLIVIH